MFCVPSCTGAADNRRPSSFQQLEPRFFAGSCFAPGAPRRGVRPLLAMADHLSNIFGTEKDKVNCPFYYRVGACRHGERCSRLHNTPLLSQTVLIPHMYLNPVAAPMIDAEGRPVEYDKKYLRDHFEEFYEDAFEELSKFGEIEELNVCDNVNEHLLGNVYIKYRTEEGAETAVKSLQVCITQDLSLFSLDNATPANRLLSGTLLCRQISIIGVLASYRLP